MCTSIEKTLSFEHGAWCFGSEDQS